MLKRLIGLVAAGSTAAALSLTIGAPSSSATTAATFSVTPGGGVTGAAAQTNVKDVTSGTPITCTSSSLNASLKSGSGLPGSGIGFINGLDFTNCMLATLPVSLSVGRILWKVNLSSSASGVSHGTITGIHVAISSSSCGAVIDGTSGSADNGKVKFTFTNKTDALKIITTDSTLHIWNVSGCLGLVASGDAANISASYKLTPAQTITSP